MSNSAIVIRKPANDAEIATHFKWDYVAFQREENPEQLVLEQRVKTMTSMPGFHADQVRSVFLDDELVGGCLVFARELRVGCASILTGCIGGVFTRPEYRQRHIATALMQDAIEFARARNYGLLLLDGIPNFYYRYGYCDIFDVSVQEIVRSALLALPASPYTVRPATIEDSEQVLALYNRYYSPYTGSFVRTGAFQRYSLERYFNTEKPLWLALEPDGQPRGYLALDYATGQNTALEFAADNWEATVALLRHHASLVEGPRAPATLRYFLPGDSPTMQQLIDHLAISEAPEQQPPFKWTVFDQTYRYRYAGWMARLVQLPVVAQAMLPEWQVRWRCSLANWSGDVVLAIGEETIAVRIAGSDVQLLEQAPATADVVPLTPQVFVQLLFGYRPASWALQQCGQPIDDILHTVLSILFPSGNTWIARSDWF